MKSRKRAYLPFANFGKGEYRGSFQGKMFLVHDGVASAAVSEEFCARQVAYRQVGVRRRGRVQRAEGGRRWVWVWAGKPNHGWNMSSVQRMLVEDDEEEREEF